MPSFRRGKTLVVVVSIWLLFMFYLFRDNMHNDYQDSSTIPHGPPTSGHHDVTDAEDVYKNGAAINGGEIGAKQWRKLPTQFPIAQPQSLPRIPSGQSNIPRMQAASPVESESAKKVRMERLAAVKESFTHSWKGYKKWAWLADEVTPITGQPKNPFGGWAATLVDTLDSLWILGMREDFVQAVQAAETIDFSTTDEDRVNVFETTIRYLGGFLAAYELSGKKYDGLLRKATEVAELLLCAFDTESHMPIARWDWKSYMTGHKQDLPKQVLVSEIGSLSMEFTKLSQLTGDNRYYDAVQRIADHFEKQQDHTRLPGMWPITVDMTPAGPVFTQDGAFTLGGMADSLYEYFPKEYLVLGGALEQPRKMYEKFIEVAKTKLFRRVLNRENRPLLVSGEYQIKNSGEEKYVAKGQHLTCFVGGMVGIASKIFDRPDELAIAEQLTDGCVWAYESCASGIMPEIFTFAPCGDIADSQTGPACAYSEEKWHEALRLQYKLSATNDLKKLISDKKLVPGFVDVSVKSYILRPEAIESVFIMHRLTGDSKWMEKAWMMFEAIEKLTRSDIGAWGLRDVMQADGGAHIDSMESFWLAETLKYFYLVFSEFDVVDLDQWVLNTEAHPLRRPDMA